MMHPVFRSFESFHNAYREGLEQLLEQPELGTFILVSANALSDRRIYERNHGRLAGVFEHLLNHYRKMLEAGHSGEASEDDLLVFLKMVCVGFEAIKETDHRRVGPWRLQFNPLRAFRPRRAAGEKPNTVFKPFNANGFHFNKPFLHKETFWTGQLGGREIRLLYNKYPFLPLHGLLVPESHRNLPQLLTQDEHHHIWELTTSLSPHLPGVGFGYNAYGAYASVNHLHFHLFIEPDGLPVMAKQWRHNGGTVDYPALCERYDSPHDAWREVDALHQYDIPYNLIYSSGCVYCLPRTMQGADALPGWSSGFAWYEMAGGFILFNREDYERIGEAELAAQRRPFPCTAEALSVRSASGPP